MERNREKSINYAHLLHGVPQLNRIVLVVIPALDFADGDLMTRENFAVSDCVHLVKIYGKCKQSSFDLECSRKLEMFHTKNLQKLLLTSRTPISFPKRLLFMFQIKTLELKQSINVKTKISCYPLENDSNVTDVEFVSPKGFHRRKRKNIFLI